ncbi:TPA: glycosyltransferase [Kluyvera cryocrescens]|nr:glycosyltransferase [Kluyvera cryocrescens]
MNSINITTTSNRLDLCSATIWSILHQSLLPDRINLWVSHEEYMADKGISAIPVWVKELNNIHDIIHVHYVDNIGPYRKIIPALRIASNEDILVYADDDVIYDHQWYESLISTFLRFEQKYIVASRVRIKKKNIFGVLQSYNMFNVCNSDMLLTKDYIVTGVGGCVIKKEHVKDDLLYLDDFKYLVPKTDDIWLSKIFELSCSSVYCISSSLTYIQEISHSNNALNQTNNIIPVGGILKKNMLKIKNRMFGYLGVAASNNDLAIRKTEQFFKDTQYEQK